MSRPVAGSEALIWTDAGRMGLCERVLGLLDAVKPLAVGGPRRSEIADLADSLSVDAYDDVKRMLTEKPADYLLLATTRDLPIEQVSGALADGVSLLTVEPLALNTDQVLVTEGGSDTPARVSQLPLARYAPGWRAATDPQQALGRIRSIQVSALSDGQAGSLFARMADAMDIAVYLLGLPDWIDAQLASSLGSPPDDLRGLTGGLTANLRYGDEAGVAIGVTDAAGLWRRTVTVVGERATLLMHDGGYRLVGSDGVLLDQSESDGVSDPAELIADQWRWLIAHRYDRDPVDRKSVIACCQAALLSCRTGQSEDPQRLLRLSV